LTLLDAYAIVAFLAGGPAAQQVRAILRGGDAAVATANLAEAIDVSQRVHGVPIARAREFLDPLLEGPLVAVVLGVDVAWRAAEIRSRHYHRSRRPLSLADSILIATAGSGDRIATADPDVLAVARDEGLNVFVLPGE
jgi:predicted nucleic acid-binding protein